MQFLNDSRYLDEIRARSHQASDIDKLCFNSHFRFGTIMQSARLHQDISAGSCLLRFTQGERLAP